LTINHPASHINKRGSKKLDRILRLWIILWQEVYSNVHDKETYWPGYPLTDDGGMI